MKCKDDKKEIKRLGDVLKFRSEETMKLITGLYQLTELGNIA